MSFILDALRKAENRNRDSHEMSVPTGPRVLIDEAPERPPNWRNVIFTGIVGLALLGAGVFFGLRENPPERAVSEIPEGSTFAANSPGTDTRTRVARPEPIATPARSPGNSAAPTAGRADAFSAPRNTGARALDREAVTSPVRRSAESASPPAAVNTTPAPRRAPVATSARVRTESLPDYLSVVQSGQVALPQLHLDMHVYSATPEKRLVFVNLNKFKEGEKIDANTTIEAIEPDGVVIDHKGLRFMLRSD